MIHSHFTAEQSALVIPRKAANAIKISVQVIYYAFLVNTNVLFHTFLGKFKLTSITLFLIIDISVDGHWGAWAAWTTCTKSCGGGEMTRERKCNDPAPHNGGATCSGNAREGGECNPDHCPGSNTYHAILFNTNALFRTFL